MSARAVWMSIGLAVLAACRGTEPVAPHATVSFVLDAPLCSSVLPVEFSIDHLLVATDTFRVNVPNVHTKSVGYTASAGSHVLGARVVNGLIWPETTVVLGAGQSFTDSLPFYCS